MITLCVWWEHLRSALLETLKYKHSIINYIHHDLHKRLKTYSSYNWKFVHFDQYFPISLISPLLLAPVNHHQSTLCFSEFKFFRFHIQVSSLLGKKNTMQYKVGKWFLQVTHLGRWKGISIRRKEERLGDHIHMWFSI